MSSEDVILGKLKYIPGDTDLYNFWKTTPLPDKLYNPPFNQYPPKVTLTKEQLALVQKPVGPENVVVKQNDLTKLDLSVAQKFDDGKTNWTLMPFEAIEEITKVLEFGARKYDSWNWTKDGGFKYSRVLNSLLRHIFAYMRGEDNDPESGLSHLAHAGCNIVFLIYFNKYKDKFNKDDRRKS